MKRGIFVFGSMLLVLVGGYFIFVKNEKIVNMPPKNDKIVMFGDSLVEGVGATTGHDLANLIEQRTGRNVMNYGKSGNTTRDALERVEHAVAEEAGVVIIVLGGNDVLRKIPKEETFQNLEYMINSFQKSGTVVILVGVRSGIVGDGRGDDYRDLAKKKGAIYVSDILQDVFGRREYMFDAVHPNDAGYAVIADRLAPVVIDLFE